MFCPKCGTKVEPGETFCHNCGTRLENNDVKQDQNVQNKVDNSYIDKAVNPKMTKWAVLSIIIPIVAIIWYWFIGLSFYVATIIAAAGFAFAQKGEMSNKKLAVVGKVLNGILMGFAIVMLIIQLIEVFK